MVDFDSASPLVSRPFEQAGKYSVWRRLAMMRGVLFCSDAVAILAAMLVAVLLRKIPGVTLHWPLYSSFSGIIIVLSTAVFRLLDVFPSVGISKPEELRRLIFGTSLVFLFVFVVSFFSRADVFVDFSRLAILFFWAASLFLIPFCRTMTLTLFAARPWWGVNVYILGTSDEAREVAQSLRAFPENGFNASGFIASSDFGEPDELEGLPVFKEDLTRDFIKNQLQAEHLIIPLSNTNRDKAIAIRDHFSRLFGYLIFVPGGVAHFGSMVQSRDLGGIMGMEVSARLLHPWPGFVKRCIEIFLAMFFGLLSLPFILLAAILIRLESRGPIFFSQERLGMNEKRFRIYKLRTRHVDAEERLQTLLETDSEMRREYEQNRKLGNDPRITRVGRWLRRFSIDEMPSSGMS